MSTPTPKRSSKMKRKKSPKKLSTPTPNYAKRSKARKSKKRTKSNEIKPSNISIAKKKRSKTNQFNKRPRTPTPLQTSDTTLSEEVVPFQKDFQTILNEAITNLSNDANKTKNDIRSVFDIFRNKLNERESVLLHNVETTLEKKSRLLQTQLECVQNMDKNGKGQQELACETKLYLTIDKAHIIRTLMTAGFIEGASSDNKEEQKMIEFEQKRRELSRQQFICIERLKQITLFERDCNSKKVDSIRLTKEVQTEIQIITKQTKVCEDKLNEAKPILEAAKKLVMGITKEQLNEIRSLKTPPRVVELVMTSIAIIFGKKVKNWRDIKKQLLSSIKFVSMILEFDTMSLTKKRRNACMKCVKNKDFNEERANKASKVAGPLVRWVNSQLKYSELLDVVRPMMKEIKRLKTELEHNQNHLSDVQGLVQDLEGKIRKARVDINGMVDNMIEMQDEYHFKQDDFIDNDDMKTEP